MFRFRLFDVATALVVSLSQAALAGPLDPATVPAAAKWVLHLDADATRASEVWKTVEPRLQQHKQYDDLVRYAKALAGMEFPRDLHAVTLYGTEFGEESAVVVVQADADQARVRDMLELADNAATATHAGQTIYSWKDDKGQHFGAFQSPQRLVIARSEANVKQALDVLGRQGAALPEGSVLAAQRDADVLLYVAGLDLAQLTRTGAAQSPLAGNVTNAWLSFASRPEAVQVRGAVTATNADTAAQLLQALNGLKAMALLSVNNEQLDEHQRAAIRTLSTLNATTDGSAVRIDWAVPMQTVRQLLDEAMKRAAVPVPAAD